MQIFIDYDTTLVNLIDPWVRWINKKYSVNLSTKDINRWYFLGEVFGKEADDFWRSERYNHYTDKEIFLPYPGAVDFVHTLQQKFGTDNVFIVSSTRDHHKKEKIEHAIHHFGIDGTQFIAAKKEKYHITKNGILIDDYPLHVMEHIVNNNQKGIVFNYENRLGWCKPCNYPLDATLVNLLEITNDQHFAVVNSYHEIIKELNHVKY